MNDASTGRLCRPGRQPSSNNVMTTDTKASAESRAAWASPRRASSGPATSGWEGLEPRGADKAGPLRDTLTTPTSCGPIRPEFKDTEAWKRRAEVATRLSDALARLRAGDSDDWGGSMAAGPCIEPDPPAVATAPAANAMAMQSGAHPRGGSSVLGFRRGCHLVGPSDLPGIAWLPG